VHQIRRTAERREKSRNRCAETPGGRTEKGESLFALLGLFCFFFVGARHLLPQQLPQQVPPGSQLQAQLGQSQQQSSVVMFASSKERESG